MKKIYISEAQEKILFREAMQGGFSFKNLEMIGSFRVESTMRLNILVAILEKALLEWFFK